MTGNQPLRTLVSLLAAAVLMLSVVHGAGTRRPGPTTLKTAPRTDSGNWYGTWIYKSRDQRILLWLRETESGKPEYRMQYQSLGTPEAFITDWTGRSEYAIAGTDAVFHLAAVKRNADSITGTLEWDLQFEDSGRRRSGEFEMFRGGDGRQLVMHFHKQALVVRRAGKEAVDEAPSAWTFIKYSKRLVLWEEVF